MPLVRTLAWYARDVLGIERVLNAVTVKRRRNPAAPVERRKSAFRDPKMGLDFLAMAWLGATRLSQIEPWLRPRDDLARVFGLRRFADHTTAHNFLNAFQRAHLRQLDEANARLLREHGSAIGQRAPILDVDVARRLVRRAGRRRDTDYRWAVAFCAGEALAQRLEHRASDWADVVLRLVASARQQLAGKPRLVRLAGTCVSADLLRALARQRLPFLASVTWAWALALRDPPRRALQWSSLDEDVRAIDLGAGPGSAGAVRTVLVERQAPAPGLRRERGAIVTTMADEPLETIVRLAASMARIRAFYGHPRWPLGDGKMPSADPRGNAAFLRLATIAMNALRLLARHLGEEWNLRRLREQLRLIPWEGDAGRPELRMRAALVVRP